MRVRSKQFVGIALALGVAGGIAWWFFARPMMIYHQARQQFEADPQHSVELLEQLLADSSSDYPAAQLLWTRALLRTGRLDEALGCFSFIKQPERLDAGELLTLSDEAMAAGAPLLAAYAVNAVPIDSSRRPDVLQRQQELCHLLRQWPRAVELGVNLTTLDPGRPQAWRLLAEAYEHLLNPTQAVIAYRSFLEREPDAERRSPALRRLVQLLMELGEVDEARRWYSEIAPRTHLSSEDLLLAAQLQRLEGHVDAAWESVQKLLNQSPQDLRAIELHGTLALDRGELDVARRDLETVLRAQPWNKSAHYKLGQLLVREGKPDDARKYLDENRRLTALSLRILDLQSKTTTGQAEIDRLTELAAAFEQIGQRDTAAGLREQARRLSP